MKNNIYVNIQISDIDDYWKSNGNIGTCLLPNKIYTLIIDYPLDKPTIFDIKTGKKGISVINLIGKIGKLYRKVYAEEADKIWGHRIEDLCLEHIEIDNKKLTIKLGVGS